MVFPFVTEVDYWIENMNDNSTDFGKAPTNLKKCENTEEIMFSSFFWDFSDFHIY